MVTRARHREDPLATLRCRRRPHAVLPRGQPIEGRAPLLIRSNGPEGQRRERKNIFEPDLVPGHGRAGRVDEFDVKNGAGLDGHGSAVQQRVCAGDMEIRQPSLREEGHVERERGDASRQRTDGDGAVAVDLVRDSIIPRLRDWHAVYVQSLATESRRNDGFACSRDESHAKIGGWRQTNHRQLQDPRERHGDADAVRGKTRSVDKNLLEPACVRDETKAARAFDGRRRASAPRLNRDASTGDWRPVGRKHVSAHAEFLGGGLRLRTSGHGCRRERGDEQQGLED